MHFRLNQPRTTPRRSAFTLIELLAVIAIIGVLAALIASAIQGPRLAARVAAAAAEIRQLETAIAGFRNEFGCDPPSSITLYEAGGTWDSVSSGKLHRIWPDFDFTLNRDLDGDGQFNSAFTLCGPECLVFFLGGMPVQSGATVTATGFSKNPADPLAINLSENRNGPFFEFKPSRLRVSSNPLSNPNPNGANPFLVYVDPIPSQTMPYLYATSNEGQGYAATDLNVGGTQVLSSVYLVGTTGQPQKPKSFQIISPGFDNAYGSGGEYDANQPQGLLTNILDYDNITNFSSGQLVNK